MFTNALAIQEHLQTSGVCFLNRSDFDLGPEVEQAWQDLGQDWADLPLDNYLVDGKSYRRRRYGRFSLNAKIGELKILPHAIYYQSEDTNVFAGGIERVFAPLKNETVNNVFLRELIFASFALFVPDVQLTKELWQVDVHQIRIISKQRDPGKPTPEGIHSDGLKFITVHLIDRFNITGGESEIYDLTGNLLARRLLKEPLDSLYADDQRVLHGVSPIHATGSLSGWRDVLLLGFDYLNEAQT